jgi:hypothetical protein
MSKEILEIRSNISTTFLEMERLRVEREEREKKEREEKWNREQAERTKLIDAWNKSHPNIYKYTYASYYNKDSFNYDYGAYCKIHFYEWSDVNREPIIFERYTRLYKFLDDCGLFIEPEDDTKIKPIASCYISCKPGSKSLIVCTTYDELKRKMREAENLANVLAPVPDTNNA